MGETSKDALRVNFDHKLRLEFHGTKVTGDAGLFQMAEVAVPRALFFEILTFYSIFKAKSLDLGGISHKIRKQMIQLIVI